MKIFKLHQDKIEVFRNWAKQVNGELREEAILSLQEENCTREIFQLFKINDIYYAVAHMEGDNIIPANVEREINKKHHEVLRECIEKQISTETLYDLSVKNSG